MPGEALQAGFHPRSTGRTDRQPPLPDKGHAVAAALSIEVLQEPPGLAWTSLFSACSSDFWVFFFLCLATSVKRFKPAILVYEEEGPSYKGKRGLKRQEKAGASPVPFFLQLCSVQKIIFHPFRETPKKQNRLAETQMPLPPALDVFLGILTHARISCDSVV